MFAFRVLVISWRWTFGALWVQNGWIFGKKDHSQGGHEFVLFELLDSGVHYSSCTGRGSHYHSYTVNTSEVVGSSTTSTPNRNFVIKVHFLQQLEYTIVP